MFWIVPPPSLAEKKGGGGTPEKGGTAPLSACGVCLPGRTVEELFTDAMFHRHSLRTKVPVQYLSVWIYSNLLALCIRCDDVSTAGDAPSAINFMSGRNDSGWPGPMSCASLWHVSSDK